MAVNDELSHGFAITHSFPNYPETLQNETISDKIDLSETINGQHAFCFTLDSSSELQHILSHAHFIDPKIIRNTISKLSRANKENETNFKDGSMMIGQDKLRIFWQNGWKK